MQLKAGIQRVPAADPAAAANFLKLPCCGLEDGQWPILGGWTRPLQSIGGADLRLEIFKEEKMAASALHELVLECPYADFEQFVEEFKKAGAVITLPQASIGLTPKRRFTVFRIPGGMYVRLEGNGE